MENLMEKVTEKKGRRTIKVRLDPEPPMPVEAVKPEKPVEKQEPKIIREYYTTIREVPVTRTITKVVRRKPAVKRKGRKPKK